MTHQLGDLHDSTTDYYDLSGSTTYTAARGIIGVRVKLFK